MLHWIRTRSRRDLILSVLIAGGFFFGVTAFLTRGIHVADGARYETKYENRGGAAYERDFEMRSTGELEIQVGDADVSVGASRGDDARLVLYVDGDEVSSEAAIEELGFEIETGSDFLGIRSREDRDWDWYESGADVSIEVTVPSGFDIDVRTGDGDIAVGSFDGAVNLTTGDGDVAIERASGSALRVQTGDGDVAVSGAVGGDVRIQTGDGDVAADYLEARDIRVQTGDGDVYLESVSGELRAMTGDGDVRVSFGEFAGAEIRTGDGDVTVIASADIQADVVLRGTEFVIGDAFALPVADFEDRRLEGRLNGGGAELRVQVGDGTIQLRRR